MSSVFTRQRVAYYCTALLISALVIQVFSIVRHGDIGGDFHAFYAEGKVALNYPHSQLYNIELQDKEYSSTIGAEMTAPLPYPPWFTIPLALLAHLPYLLALTLWTLISLSLMTVGFLLIARVLRWPASWNYLGVLVCLAFPPYLFYSLINGQAAAFAFCVLALTYYLQKNGRPALAGMILSLLTYKPTLLLFLGPMLVFIRQWRILSGLTLGAAMLALLSLLWAGVEGVRGFFKLADLFIRATNSTGEVFQTHKYIDIGAAVRLLFGPQPAVRLTLVLCAFPLVCFLWYRLGPRSLSWSLAIVCGLIFSLYSPIYDCTLILFAVMIIGVETLHSWLIGALFLVPAVTVSVARLTGVQLYTLVLIALLITLVRRSLTLAGTNSSPHQN
jgi:alpha-1,2-mannosyltransferase